MLPLPPNVPTITSYCRFLYDIPSAMPQHQDGLMASNTAYTRYKQVHSWDARLRNLATTERPAFFTTAPLQPGWPCWVPWALRALAISSSHEIIMIHRSFLSEGFTNPAFAFTHRLMRPALQPEIIYDHPHHEQDVVLWYNRALWHSIAEFPKSYGPRVMHQCNVADIKSFNEKGGVLSGVTCLLSGAENVRVVGKGYQGKDHYGIMDKIISKTPSHDFHDLLLSDDDFEAGHTRFLGWHIGAPLHDREPAWFATL
ncbi:hypothetical protein ACJZ2D_000397 [Fusarium nematophilum]